MKIGYKARGAYFVNAIPELRLSNKYLRQFGFEIGQVVNIEYSDGLLVIRKAEPAC